jgi:PAS domain S-box-containing protein
VSRADHADYYAAIVEDSDDAILSKDPNGIITTWNPAAERLYGYEAKEAIGQPISILIPAHRAGEETRILAEVMRGDRIDHYETERVRKDGRMVEISVSVSPVRNEAGEVVSASVIARDVGERRRAQELAARLQSVTAALSAEITPDRANEVLLEQAVAGLGADAGAIGIADRARGEIELAGTVGHSEEGLSGWERFPLDAELPMSVAIRSGEPIWTSSGEELKERFPLLAGAAMPFSALAVIPLSVEGNRFGALSLSFTDAREFGTQERAFLGAAAQQVAYALERSRLHEGERAARERLSFLAEAGELLGRSLDPEMTMRRFAELTVSRMCDWCAVDLLDDDGRLQSVAVAHVDPELVRLVEELRSRYPPDRSATQGTANVVRTGQPELYAEIPDKMLIDAAEDDEHLRRIRDLSLVSAMVVPLRARGRALGAITFVSSDPGRHYGEADLRLAEELVRRAALALDNATLFRREHEAALTLQRSLLPQSLPAVEGVRFAVRYDPVAPGLEVGGDWYEAVARDDGVISITIGDVAGRGIRAAAVMGRARQALRAYVLDGHSPCDAIVRLDRQLKDAERPEMTTVLHLHFDPRSGAAEYVRAGHPPGLVRRPDGEIVELAAAGTPPLGIFGEFTCRHDSVELAPGALLLLYTDGLIERRGLHFDVGLERLKGVLERAPQDPEACLDFVAEQCRSDEIPDDVAMLAMAVDEPAK